MSRKFYEELQAMPCKELKNILTDLCDSKVVEINLAAAMSAGSLYKGIITGFKAPDVSDDRINALNESLKSAKGRDAQLSVRKEVANFCNSSISVDIEADGINYRLYLNISVGNIHKCLWTVRDLFRSLGVNAKSETVSAVEAMRWVINNLANSIGKQVTICAYSNGDYTNYCFGDKAEQKFAELQASRPEPKKAKAKAKPKVDLA